MAPSSRPEPGPDETAAVRTLLELVAELMEESFAVMGEGHILGTMPSYLESFGAGNARYMAQRFLVSAQVRGPRAALSPMALVSLVTDTPFEVEAGNGGIVKRLHHCEFAPAFSGRGEFPRAMMCMLHRAAYQGSVNGLVAQPGYDVQLTRRILFGDSTCDFLVLPRQEIDDEDAEIEAARDVGQQDRTQLAYEFYTFLLASFVDYLSHHLEEALVEDLLRRVAARVGGKVRGLLAEAGMAGSDAEETARHLLILGGRRLGPGLHVTACPQAAAIRSSATGASEEERQRIRRNVCRLCKNLVAGAVRDADAGARLHREESLALGDARCDFEVRHAG